MQNLMENGEIVYVLSPSLYSSFLW